MRRFLLSAAVLPVLLAAVHLLDLAPPAMRDLEARTLTWRYMMRGPLAASDAVALVMIDDATVAALGQWPVSRRHLAEATRILAEAGAAAVAFDLLFVEPDMGLPAEARAVLKAARTRLGDGDGIGPRIDRLLASADGDAAFAAAIAEAGNVVLPFAFVFDDRPGDRNGLPAVVERAAFGVVDRPVGAADAAPPSPSGVVAPLSPLAESAATLGHVTVLLDRDGALRHDQAVIGFGEGFYPSLPVAALLVRDGVAANAGVLHLGEGVDLGGRRIPTDGRMRLTVNHYGPAGTISTHSLIDLLEGRVPPAALAGRVVIVGASAHGAADLFVTPFTQRLPGAEHYATVVDNIVTGRLLVDRDRTAWIDGLAILACGIAAAAFGRFLPPALGVAGLAGLAAGWFLVAAAAFAMGGLWLEVTHPAAAAALGFGVFATLRLGREGRARRLAERQRRNLSRYFSPQVATRLMDSDRPGLDDRTQQAAILFVDIVGFTGLAEHLAPHEAMNLLRRFYRLIEDSVFAHGGVVDKYLGDGAMAIFGVPDPGPADAERALRAARAMVDGVLAWRAEPNPSADAMITIAVGVHYGPVLVGDAGGARQFAFTVTGDAANTASRLETLCRRVGAAIVASDAVVELARATGGTAAVQGFVALPPRRLRGRERPLGLWCWRVPRAPAPGIGADGAGRSFPPK